MKKGFTLIELLGVLVIIGILLTVIFATVGNFISDGRNDVYQKQINSIIDGTYDWTLKHPNELPKSKGDKKYISLLKLQKNGYVDEFINANTKEKFPINLVIKIEYTGGNYKYNSNYSKLYGNYLYTVLIENLDNQEYIERKPEIKLEGPTLNSDGTYTSTFELGGDITSYSCSATSYKNETITSIEEIILTDLNKENGKEVKFIDTNKLGIYYKYYIAIDNEGYSSYIIENIIIRDNQAPTLVIPENDVIGTSVTTYDLMQGVTCTDNSEKCDISTEGIIKFGIPDSYQIKYIAKDPSGNTTTQTRTIRVSD